MSHKIKLAGSTGLRFNKIFRQWVFIDGKKKKRYKRNMTARLQELILLGK